MPGGESDAEKQNRRQTEAAFNQQQALLTQQEEFLQQGNAQSTRILGLLKEAEAGNVASAELAQAELQRALEGNPTDAQLQFEQDIMDQTLENIRKSGNTPDSQPGIFAIREANEAIAASRDARRQGDIQAAVQAGSLSQGTFNTNLQNQLIAATSPLTNTQALGQSISNLGKLSQFNQPRNNDLRNVSGSVLGALGQSPNFLSNIGGNISGLGSALSGGRVGTSFATQQANQLSNLQSIFGGLSSQGGAFQRPPPKKPTI